LTHGVARLRVAGEEHPQLVNRTTSKEYGR
jgi:hypothetical protein